MGQSWRRRTTKDVSSDNLGKISPDVGHGELKRAAICEPEGLGCGRSDSALTVSGNDMDVAPSFDAPAPASLTCGRSVEALWLGPKPGEYHITAREPWHLSDRW